MSGVRVIHYLLANNATLVAACAAAKIFTGKIPLGTVLPAISVNEISVVERLTVAMTAASEQLTARVQVTVQAKTYTDQKAILLLVRKACPNTRGSVDSIDVDSILPDGAGPDFRDDDAGIFMQSRDFIVRFNAATS